MNADLQEALALLKKYQARYHGAPHAQKDWEKTDAFIKRIEAGDNPPNVAERTDKGCGPYLSDV